MVSYSKHFPVPRCVTVLARRLIRGRLRTIRVRCCSFRSMAANFFISSLSRHESQLRRNVPRVSGRLRISARLNFRSNFSFTGSYNVSYASKIRRFGANSKRSRERARTPGAPGIRNPRQSIRSVLHSGALRSDINRALRAAARACVRRVRGGFRVAGIPQV